MYNQLSKKITTAKNSYDPPQPFAFHKKYAFSASERDEAFSNFEKLEFSPDMDRPATPGRARRDGATGADTGPQSDRAKVRCQSRSLPLTSIVPVGVTVMTVTPGWRPPGSLAVLPGRPYPSR
jgi:hypothetical protein